MELPKPGLKPIAKDRKLLRMILHKSLKNAERAFLLFLKNRLLLFNVIRKPRRNGRNR
jgi:hypothetical protein